MGTPGQFEAAEDLVDFILGCIALASAVCSGVVCYRVVRSRNSGRLLLKQLSHLSLVTFFASLCDSLKWFVIFVEDHTENMPGQVSRKYCTVMVAFFRFFVLWGCLVNAHIVVGVLLAGRKATAVMTWFPRTTRLLPLCAFVMNLPQLIWIGTFDDHGVCIQDNPTAHSIFVVEVLLIFIVILVSFGQVMTLMNSSAPGSVIDRVLVNTRVFVIIYLVVWLPVCILWVLEVTEDEKHDVLEWITHFFLAAQGVMQFSAYMSVVRTRVERRPQGPRDVTSFNVMFAEDVLVADYCGDTAVANHRAEQETQVHEYLMSQQFAVRDSGSGRPRSMSTEIMPRGSWRSEARGLGARSIPRRATTGSGKPADEEDEDEIEMEGFQRSRSRDSIAVAKRPGGPARQPVAPAAGGDEG
mmetsp:Transcript_97456/g.260103  ORF Transcript_97456/g.260103 Transcript_97456/m.260103 type:complete len:411 (+) Transcript_97456:76-1308(+)